MTVPVFLRFFPNIFPFSALLLLSSALYIIIKGYRHSRRLAAASLQPAGPHHAAAGFWESTHKQEERK
jgi:hypothetical protein